jgi:hypothetical protein
MAVAILVCRLSVIHGIVGGDGSALEGVVAEVQARVYDVDVHPAAIREVVVGVIKRELPLIDPVQPQFCGEDWAPAIDTWPSSSTTATRESELRARASSSVMRAEKPLTTLP